MKSSQKRAGAPYDPLHGPPIYILAVGLVFSFGMFRWAGMILLIPMALPDLLGSTVLRFIL
jgi:hypothetical protein